ncbi:MAG: OmpA family protein [Clostridia bacterium]|nr:OmpA family protein [Clostridia bacterium]
MARQRIHNSRAGKGGNSGASWISYSDLMCALLLMFVLMLCVILYQYFTMIETKTAELDQQKLLITDQQLKLDEQTLQIAAQQVTMDHQNAQIAVIMTQLDEQASALEEAYIILGENQAKLQEAQSTLAGKEAQLIILQQELANKENELNAAIQVLNAQQAALASKTDEIEDMVGMKTEIIAELSTSLSRANLSAAVDKNTGDIVLDSAVLFKTGSSDIQADGKYLLNRFIPVYLEVLLRPEYADYLGQIVIEGHTDDVGTWENNMKLSQERAYEVMMYVLGMYREGSAERELLQQLLTATGRSETDLIYYPGTYVVNQDASRRVEFKFSLKDAEMIEEMNRLLQGN